MDFIASFFRRTNSSSDGEEHLLPSNMEWSARRIGDFANRPYPPPESLFQNAPEFDMLMEDTHRDVVGTESDEYLAWYDPMREGSLTNEQYMMSRYSFRNHCLEYRMNP